MTLNVGKWIYTVNHHMIEYAKSKGYKYFYNSFFRLKIIIDNKIYIIDTYHLNNDNDLIIDLKLT